MSGKPPTHLHALPPGTCLKQTYRIQSVLGEGGFGITYKGFLPCSGSVVAIKEYFPPSLAVRSRQEGDFTLYPYPEKNTGTFCHERTRFLEEAAILRSFQHLDSIVSVYDFFEENGTAYLVMEYIEGLTLRQYVNEYGTLTFPEISSLVQPVIHSMAEVHEKGLIHRDISPDNLIIGTDNCLHLIDFGAARRKNHTSPQNTVMLKAGYTPPEQYVSTGKIGAWTDIYALCATIYFTLTGAAPAEAIHRLDSDSAATLPGLSHLLIWQRTVLERGLQLRPADRFPDMHSLWSALNGESPTDRERTVMPSSPPKAVTAASFTKTDTAPEEDGSPDRTHLHTMKIRMLATGIVVLALVTGIVFFSRPSADLPSPGAGETPRTDTHSRTASATRHAQTQPPQDPVPPTPAATTAPQSILTMPDLTGKTLKKAKKELKKLDSSIHIRTTYSYSNKVPAGTVISQSIKKGISFSRKQFSSLALTVSKGRKPAPTPAATPRPTKSGGSPDYHVTEDDDSLSSVPFD